MRSNLVHLCVDKQWPTCSGHLTNECVGRRREGYLGKVVGGPKLGVCHAVSYNSFILSGPRPPAALDTGVLTQPPRQDTGSCICSLGARGGCHGDQIPSLHVPHCTQGG